MSIRLDRSLNAWKTPSFREILKNEIEGLGAGMLPLQQGLTQGSYAGDEFKVMIISVLSGAGMISVKAGIFYSSTIPGCNCADDPTPVDEQNEYCELQFDINMENGDVTIALSRMS